MLSLSISIFYFYYLFKFTKASFLHHISFLNFISNLFLLLVITIGTLYEYTSLFTDKEDGTYLLSHLYIKLSNPTLNYYRYYLIFIIFTALLKLLVIILKYINENLLKK